MQVVPHWAWAPLLGTLYILISWRTKDLFPFSRYAMYSSAVNRTVGAIPVVLADGEYATLTDFTEFTGFTPSEFYPRGIPCSLEWKIHEAERYVEQHGHSGPTGNIEIIWGFLYVSVDEAGKIHEKLQVIQRGFARRIE